MENNENNFDMNEEKNEVTPEQAPETPVAPEAPAPEAPKAAQAAPAAGADEGKGFSIAALVLGIAGIVGGWFPVIQYFTLVCAILGIIFGVKGKKMSAAVYWQALRNGYRRLRARHHRRCFCRNRYHLHYRMYGMHRRRCRRTVGA